jgi:3-hydroxyacyl-[acyl-carrier-protein] dehydratase
MRLEYFQMLDAIERIDRDAGRIVARALVPETSPVFEGHFPGHPILPGVLMLETMAQASGYLLLALGGFTRMPFFANTKEANFRSFVEPGTALVVEASRVHAGSGYAVMQAEIKRDGKRVADAQLTFRTVPFPNEALKRHVENEGRRLGFLDGAASGPARGAG